MNEVYVFRIGPLTFMLNVQESSIGFSYPRVFVRFPDNSYLNCDLTLGAVFNMTEEQWLSWYDGTEKYLNTIDEVYEISKQAGIKWSEFEKVIFEYYKETKNS